MSNLKSYEKDPFWEFFMNGLDNYLYNKKLPSTFKTNIWEDEKNFYIEAELPGIEKSDLEVTIREDILKITAKRKSVKIRNYLLKEITENDFERMFRLPKNIDKSNINAKQENGVLLLTLNKSEEKTKKINVTIK